MNRGFFVGSGTIHGDDGTFPELLVQHAEAFLDEVWVGGLEGCASVACGGWGCGADSCEPVFLWFGDGLSCLRPTSAGTVTAAAGAEARPVSPVATFFIERGSATEGGFSRLVDEFFVDFLDEP